jgi:D-3-phosphoglycerate dehydrogenase / 2-oxoglutarate reductase
VRFALLEALHDDAEALLRDAGEVVVAAAPAGDAAIEAVRGADAVLTRGRGRVTAEVIAAGTQLRVIARAGVGIDNIDGDAASARGLPIVIAPGSTTTALAEHTLMLVLAACRRLRTLANAVAGGDWAIRDGHLGRELTGATLGIVGLGDIGSRVAELASAFGMRVRYWSRSATDTRFEREEDLDALTAGADVVSLHVALTPDTRGLMDARRVAAMKPGAVLVNTARGALVDEQAVAAALDAGRLSAFAADVLAEEPPGPASPLAAHPKAIVTPHVGAITDSAYRDMCVRVAGDVLRLLRGEAPSMPEAIANRARL